MTRDAAIEYLKDKPPGSFIVRDSTSYPGGYGLAMKVPDRGEHKTPEECVSFPSSHGEQHLPNVRESCGGKMGG